MTITVDSYVRIKPTSSTFTAGGTVDAPVWGRVLAEAGAGGPFTVLFANFNLMTTVLLVDLDEIIEASQSIEDDFTGKIVRRLVTVGSSQVQATAEMDGEVVSVFAIALATTARVIVKTLQGNAYYEVPYTSVVVLDDR